MNTKVLMAASAVIFGLILSFLPNETALFFNSDFNIMLTLFIQLVGALYLGFAMMNWMAKGSTIGGIYNKPIAIGNFMHFATATIVFSKALTSEASLPMLVGMAIYATFSLWFGLVIFRHPGVKKEA